MGRGCGQVVSVLAFYFQFETPWSMQFCSVKLCDQNESIQKSPGLVVIGGDSCSKGCGFESQHRRLDEHFSHIFVVKILMFVWKD